MNETSNVSEMMMPGGGMESMTDAWYKQYELPTNAAYPGLKGQDNLAHAINVAWLLVSAILVFMMQGGFAMLESGFIQLSHSRNILFKNLLDVCVGALTYWAFGWAFAWGTGGSFIGTSDFFLSSTDDVSTAPLSKYASWFFQFSFAATSATIVSGAVAERAKWQAYLVFAVVLTSFVYPLVSRWVWNEVGWLSMVNPDAVLGGMIDFAGSGVVHMVGGISGLMGTAILGYRNRLSVDKENHPPRFELVRGKWVINDLPPSSEQLAALGVFILWFGWFGFNGGSIVTINGGNAASHTARVIVNTALAPATCCLTCLWFGRLLEGFRARADPDHVAQTNLSDAMNGILAGLVSVTAGCAVFETWAAVVVGFVGAFVYKGASTLLLRFRIDDPLDAFAVHGASGAWGVLAASLLASPSLVVDVYGTAGRTAAGGLFITGNTSHFGAAVVGILAITGWTVLFSGIMFFAMVRIDRNRTETIFISKTSANRETLAFGTTGIRKPAMQFIMPQHYALAAAEAGVAAQGPTEVGGGTGIDLADVVAAGGPPEQAKTEDVLAAAADKLSANADSSEQQEKPEKKHRDRSKSPRSRSKDKKKDKKSSDKKSDKKSSSSSKTELKEMSDKKNKGSDAAEPAAVDEEDSDSGAL